MGIHGLWKIVEPAAQEMSFQGMATREGFKKSRTYPLCIGIDVGIWIAACEAAARAASVYTQRQNASLLIFFNRLARLLNIPATFVFVLDGPDRPPHKRGTNVIKRPVWVIEYLKPLIDAFGFHYHQAPGDAEAELVALEKMNLIDAIFTDDGDALVLGGMKVIRCLPNAEHYNSIRVYTSDALQHHDEVQLTRGGLLLYALCAGGDFSGGLTGCGPETSLALARLGFGDELLGAYETLSPEELASFLVLWRQRLRNIIINNPEHALPRARPSLAPHITDSFPDLSILASYYSPVTSWNYPGPPPSERELTWLPRLPRLVILSRFCVAQFGWDHKVLLGRFHERIWSGLTLRLIAFPMILFNPHLRRLSAPDIHADLIQEGRQLPIVGTGGVRLIDIRVATEGFIAAMGPEWPPHASSLRSVSAKVPLAILRRVVPNGLMKPGTFRSPILVEDEEEDEVDWLLIGGGDE